MKEKERCSRRLNALKWAVADCQSGQARWGRARPAGASSGSNPKSLRPCPNHHCQFDMPPQLSAQQINGRAVANIGRHVRVGNRAQPIRDAKNTQACMN